MWRGWRCRKRKRPHIKAGGNKTGNGAKCRHIKRARTPRCCRSRRRCSRKKTRPSPPGRRGEASPRAGRARVTSPGHSKRKSLTAAPLCRPVSCKKGLYRTGITNPGHTASAGYKALQHTAPYAPCRTCHPRPSPPDRRGEPSPRTGWAGAVKERDNQSRTHCRCWLHHTVTNSTVWSVLHQPPARLHGSTARVAEPRKAALHCRTTAPQLHCRNTMPHLPPARLHCCCKSPRGAALHCTIEQRQ